MWVTLSQDPKPAVCSIRTLGPQGGAATIRAVGKGRREAFSDGVIAIIITIMVLEMRPPAGGDFRSLAAIAPVFGSYVLSFIFLGIYWSNHHHLLQTVRRVNGAILWANLHLLFW